MFQKEQKSKTAKTEASDSIEKLKDLAKLKAEGIITEEEFIKMKKKIVEA